MRIALMLLAGVLFSIVTYDVHAEAIYGARGVQAPYKFVSGNACTISYPGQFTWAANIAPAALNLSDAEKMRLIELIDLATLNPTAVTDDTRSEFANIMKALRVNARIVRNNRVVGRCSLKRKLGASVFRERADSSLPVIRIGSRNCSLPKGARLSLRSGDRIAVFESDSPLIAATLKRCSDGCGVVNCR